MDTTTTEAAALPPVPEHLARFVTYAPPSAEILTVDDDGQVVAWDSAPVFDANLGFWLSGEEYIGNDLLGSVEDAPGAAATDMCYRITREPQA